MRQTHAPLSRRGFSLIEILVAMTILVVIVLIVAGIFQQTSLAWTLGLQRSTNQANVRAVAGALGRDLATMVDPGNFAIYPSKNGDGQAAALEAGLKGDTSEIGASGKLTFWALQVPDLFDDDTKDASRELVQIEYAASGSTVTRKVLAYDPTSGSLSETESQGGSSSTFDLGDGSVEFEAIEFTSDEFSSPYGSTVAGVRIKISPSKPAAIAGYEIYVGSHGPDGPHGTTEDDIYPWGEGEAE